MVESILIPLGFLLLLYLVVRDAAKTGVLAALKEHNEAKNKESEQNNA